MIYCVGIHKNEVYTKKRGVRVCFETNLKRLKLNYLELLENRKRSQNKKDLKFCVIVDEYFLNASK